ncbi:integrase [Gemmata obscuriglobus]|uniref:Integrase n=2 Tax=Gemmata obscuriglobus TaxID=114 RepID=A0A2Z3GZG2_9BACT|nr:integrase [Gemmata obscuriglobus]
MSPERANLQASRTSSPKEAKHHAERFEDIGSEADRYVEKSRAPNTRRAQRSDWKDFSSWCAKYARSPLPAAPDTVAYYLADRSQELKTSTLQRRLMSISDAHRTAGFDSPTKSAQVKLVWAGIRRDKGVAQNHKKPTLTKHIREMVEHLPQGLLGVRDRALLLLGFAGAMRRSELVGIDATDVALTDEGLVVTIRKSKTDQVQEGRTLGIPYGEHEGTCPVRAVLAWVDQAAILEGPLFRSVNKHGHVMGTRLSDRTVAEVVKRSLVAAGHTARGYAAHSLRAGLITQAAIAGASDRDIQDQSGHKSLLVMRRYIRDGSLFRQNVAAKVGL